MSSSRRCASNSSTNSGLSSSSSGSSSGRGATSSHQQSSVNQPKHLPSLYSMRGKSWSCFHKFISNILEDNTIMHPVTDFHTDVHRLDVKDYSLYGISPSEPGPMVLCNQCNHIMAPEGIIRHVKRVHGSKLVSMYKARPPVTTATKSSVTSTATSTLATAFTNRLNVSKMAPPAQSSVTGSGSSSTTTSTTDSKYNKYKVPSSFEDAHVLLNKDDVISNLSSGSGAATTSTVTSSNTLLLTSSNLQSVSASSTSSNSSGISSSSNSNSSTSSSLSKSSTLSTALANVSSRRNRKVLPIKDREYDPEKHCGVAIGMGRPCTRSLTCKTHQISLRRNVGGRSKPFDQLLAEHRNHAKDSTPLLQPALSANLATTVKQINSSLSILSSDSNIQHMLIDTIIDSNSSSSFDLERRSLSSNSNHSSPLVASLSDLQTGTVSALGSAPVSSISVAPSNVSHLAYDALSVPSKGSSKTSQFSKSEGKLASSTVVVSSSSARTNSGKSKSSLGSTAKSLSSTKTVKSQIDNTSLHTPTTTSISIAINDYSMQMNHLNDLINDEHGDGLDMGFWEDFENIPYEGDLMANSHQQSHNDAFNQLASSSSLLSANKIPPKRSSAHSQQELEQLIERKRRRVNLNVISNIPSPTTPTASINANADGIATSIAKRSDAVAPEQAISRIAAEIEYSSAPFDSKGTAISSGNGLNNTITIENIMKHNRAKDLNTAGCDTNGELNAKKIAADKRNSVIQMSRKRLGRPQPREIKKDNKTVGVQEIICIDDDDDDDDNNNLDTTTNKNGGTKRTMPVIPSISSTNKLADHETNGEDYGSSSDEDLSHELAVMTLSSKDSLGPAQVGKYLAESDCMPANTNTTNPPPTTTTATLPYVPLDEKEHYVLDMVYKCIRRRVRMIAAQHRRLANIKAQRAAARAATNGVGIDKEKENSVETSSVYLMSDDEGVVVNSAKSPGTSVKSVLLTASQRNSKKICHSFPKPISVNHFAMARGRGICQFKYIIDSTKKTQQQIYHGLQSHQHNGGLVGIPFGSASLIALRNNGRFNSNSVMGIGMSLSMNQHGITNKGIASPHLGAAGAIGTANAGKGMAKKGSVSMNNTLGNNNATPNSDNSGSGGQSGTTTHAAYTIIRRPVQNMQMLASRTDQSAFPVMPVIHRVRTRSLLPTVPKNIQAQTGKLLKNISKGLQMKLRNSASISAIRKSHPSSNQSASVHSVNLPPTRATSAGASTPSHNTTTGTPSTHVIKSSKHQQKSRSHKVSTSSKYHTKQNGHVHSAGNTSSSNHISKHLQNSAGGSSSRQQRSATRTPSTLLLNAQSGPQQTQQTSESLLLVKQQQPSNANTNYLLLKQFQGSNARSSQPLANNASGQQNHLGSGIAATNNTPASAKDDTGDGQAKKTAGTLDANNPLGAEQCVICAMQRRHPQSHEKHQCLKHSS